MKSTAWISALALIATMVGFGVAKVDAGGTQQTGTPVATQSDKPNKMHLVFEAAYQAMLIEEPLAAARLLEHVSTIFPTPAVFNNAGIARAMHAVSLQEKQEPQLVYPWVLDTDLRFEDVETVRRTVPASRGTKWVGEANDHLIRALLINEAYLPALINHVTVEGLRGRLASVSDEAVNAILAARHAGNQRAEALALTAQGIAYVSCTDTRREIGREFLLNAEKLGYELASVNLSILDGSPPLPAAASMQVDVEMSPEERIENFAPIPALTQFPGTPLKSFHVAARSRASLPAVALSWKEHDAAQMLTLRVSPVKLNEQAKTYVLLRTGDGYAGQTGRGLVLGSRVEEIRQAYGAPSRVIDKLDGQFLVYSHPRMVFEFSQGRLAGWLLYEPVP